MAGAALFADVMPADMPVDDITAIMLDPLALFEPGEAFRMQVTHATLIGLTLDAVTDRDRAILKV